MVQILGFLSRSWYPCNDRSYVIGWLWISAINRSLVIASMSIVLRRPTQWLNADWTLTSRTRMVPRPLEILVREFPGISGNMSLEKFSREFPGILLRFAYNFLYNIISSFDKCSYSARHNVKARSLQFCWFDWNFDKSLSRDFSAHKIRFRRVFLPTFSPAPILFRRHADWWFCTELNRAL